MLLEKAKLNVDHPVYKLFSWHFSIIEGHIIIAYDVCLKFTYDITISAESV